LELVLADDTDRLNRPIEATANLNDQLQFIGTEIYTLNHGRISDIQVGISGLLGENYVKNLAQKTRRGLEGRVREGKSGGGRSYGYDVVGRLKALRLVEEGHSDPAVAGPRLNELATSNQAIADELLLQPDDVPAIRADDGATSYRKLVEGLRLKTLGGEPEERKAADLVRSLVRRIVVLPREEDEPQGIEIEAGSSPIGVNTDRDCNIGCGGAQPTIPPKDSIRSKCLKRLEKTMKKSASSF